MDDEVEAALPALIGEAAVHTARDARSDAACTRILVCAASALLGGALHQHKLHLSQMYGLRRDQASRIFFENDRLVFHKSE